MHCTAAVRCSTPHGYGRSPVAELFQLSLCACVCVYTSVREVVRLCATRTRPPTKACTSTAATHTRGQQTERGCIGGGEPCETRRDEELRCVPVGIYRSRCLSSSYQERWCHAAMLSATLADERGRDREARDCGPRRATKTRTEREEEEGASVCASR